MRIHSYISRGEKNCTFLLSDSDNDGGNFFSILVGENGAGKSRFLRDVFNTTFNSMLKESLFDELGVVEDSFGKLTLIPKHDDGFSWPPSQIIALSGVATDKFPNKRSLASRNGSKFDSSKYLYCGPKSENGMVSRNLSERQLYVEILKNLEKDERRDKAVSAAFDFFPQASGAVFRIGEREKSVPPLPSNMAQLRKHIENFLSNRVFEKSQVSTGDRTFADELEVIAQNREFLDTSIRILRNPSEFGWNLSNQGGVDYAFSGNERTALRILLTMRLIRMQGALLMPNGKELAFEMLSSGQWQVFSSILLVAFAAEDDALILVDEPENSLHPAWQQKYLPTLKNALDGIIGAHVMVATHSPLVASSVQPNIGTVCAVKRKQNGGLEAKVLSQATYGWSADDILQEVFELPSSRSIGFRRDLDDALRLIGEGKIDDKRLGIILERLNAATATLPNADAIREVVATMNALAGGHR